MGIIRNFLIKIGIIKVTSITHKLIARYFKKIGFKKCYTSLKDIKYPKEMSKYMSFSDYQQFRTFFKRFQDLYIIHSFNKLLLKHNILQTYYSSAFIFFKYQNLNGEEFLKRHKEAINYEMVRQLRYYGSYGCNGIAKKIYYDRCLYPESFSYDDFDIDWKKILKNDEIINWKWE